MTAVINNETKTSTRLVSCHVIDNGWRHCLFTRPLGGAGVCATWLSEKIKCCDINESCKCVTSGFMRWYPPTKCQRLINCKPRKAAARLSLREACIRTFLYSLVQHAVSGRLIVIDGQIHKLQGCLNSQVDWNICLQIENALSIIFWIRLLVMQFRMSLMPSCSCQNLMSL